MFSWLQNKEQIIWLISICQLSQRLYLAIDTYSSFSSKSLVILDNLENFVSPCMRLTAQSHVRPAQQSDALDCRRSQSWNETGPPYDWVSFEYQWHDIMMWDMPEEISECGSSSQDKQQSYIFCICKLIRSNPLWIHTDMLMQWFGPDLLL